jgi:hypothetical protein
MAQVPYSSIPEVAPTINGTGAAPVSVEAATPNAFGAQIGTAEQQAGEQTNQLAQKFATIYNESTARDATTKTAQQMADAEAAFHQLKGNDAVKGLKPFQDQISQIVKDNSAGLSLNANSMYQRDSAGLVNNAKLKAGMHVGDQAEKAQTDSLNASITTNVNQFAMNATNPTGITYLNKIQDDALSYAHHMGITDPNVADQLVSHNYGEAFAAAIKTNMQSNPAAAQRLWEQASTGVITKTDGTTVPYLDAAHRASISSEMQGEFRNQRNQVLKDQADFASYNGTFDKNAVSSAILRAGGNQTDVDAQILRLQNIRDVNADATAKTTVKDFMTDASAKAINAGVAPTNVPSDDIIQRAVGRNNPDGVAQFKQGINNLNTIASVRSALNTAPRSQANALIDAQTPNIASTPADAAIGYVIKNSEGGFVPVDGATNAPSIYGINQKWHPDEYAAAKKIYDTQGDAAGQQYAANFYKTEYWDKKGIGNLPASTQAVVMDGVVNHSVAFGNQLIDAAKSGSSAQDLIDMRRQEYTRLATEDPAAYGKSLAGWNSRLDKLQAALPQLNQGNSYATQLSLHDDLQNMAKQYYKQLDDDPAGVITAGDSVLTNLYQEGAKDPAKMNEYISAVSSRQAALEVPEDARSVLPAAYAQQLVQNMMKTPTEVPTQLRKMQAEYGGNYQKVYQDLVNKGGLTQDAQLSSHVDSNPDPSLAQYAPMGLRIGTDDTKGKTNEELMGGKLPYDTMRKAIAGSPMVGSLLQSFAASNASPSDLAKMQSSIENLAVGIHTYALTPTERANATELAIRAVTSQYDFMSDMTGGARIPVAKAQAVEYNAFAKAMTISDDDVSVNQKITNYADRKSYIDSLRTSPTWITDEANNRIVLSDNHGQPVFDRAGKRIAIGFDDPQTQWRPPSQSIYQMVTAPQPEPEDMQGINQPPHTEKGKTILEMLE